MALTNSELTSELETLKSCMAKKVDRWLFMAAMGLCLTFTTIVLATSNTQDYRQEDRVNGFESSIIKLVGNVATLTEATKNVKESVDRLVIYD